MDREVTRDHARSGYRGRLCGTSPVPGGDRAAPRASVTAGPRARTDSCRAALALRVIVGRFCEHERNETSNCVSRSLALVWGTHPDESLRRRDGPAETAGGAEGQPRVSLLWYWVLLVVHSAFHRSRAFSNACNVILEPSGERDGLRLRYSRDVTPSSAQLPRSCPPPPSGSHASPSPCECGRPSAAHLLALRVPQTRLTSPLPAAEGLSGGGVSALKPEVPGTALPAWPARMFGGLG